MKKILYTVSLLLLLSSCADDFLDTKSNSTHDTSYLFNTVPYTEAAINGIYGKLTESNVYDQYLSVNWTKNSDIEYAGLTDDPKNPTRNGESNYYASNLNKGLAWDAIYNAAQLSTYAVNGIRESSLMKTADSTLMKAFLGEALTLRALTYFELVKIYGDIPFNEKSVETDLSNAYKGRVNRDIIYQQVISDLMEAENYIPWQGGSVSSRSYSGPEVVTKGFIKGLTARIALFAGGWSLRDGNQFPDLDLEKHPDIAEMNGYYVGRPKNWQEYYEIAAQQCAEIIGSTEHTHRLTPSFEEYWKNLNGLKNNMYNESLFEIAFGVGQSGNLGNLIGMYFAANVDRYGGRGVSGGNVKSTAYYFYSFDKDDTRRDVTVSTISYANSNKEALGGDPTNYNFHKWRLSWMTSGFLSLYRDAQDRIGTGVNWVVMRLPDIYLMYAEAQYVLHGEGNVNITAGISPKEALERVRERAFGSGHSSITKYDSNFFEAVSNERAWEFGGEALRKYDLIRWGLLAKKIDIQKEALSKLINKKNGEVKIFDKTYQLENLPTYYYYKYEKGGEFIDKTSINYYVNLANAPSTEYSSVRCLYEAGQYRSNCVSWVSQLMASSSGINASYDPAFIINQLDSATSINVKLNGLSLLPLGNKSCNYRHLYPIYYVNINDAQGSLKNSYGY